MKTYFCEYCGKKNTTKRKDKYVKYCNMECYQKSHAKTILKNKCDACGEAFELLEVDLKRRLSNGNKIYCSDLCRRLHNQIKVFKKHNIVGVTIDNKFYVKECEICNSLFEVRKQKANVKFCSKECISYNFKTNNERKNKISLSTLGPKHHAYIHDRDRTKVRDRANKILKDEVYSLFNNKCFRCGSRDKLCIDHHYPNIKGWKLNISNAVLLCKSCNSSKHAKDPEKFYTQKELKKLNKLGIKKESLFNFMT